MVEKNEETRIKVRWIEEKRNKKRNGEGGTKRETVKGERGKRGEGKGGNGEKGKGQPAPTHGLAKPSRRKPKDNVC